MIAKTYAFKVYTSMLSTKLASIRLLSTLDKEKQMNSKQTFYLQYKFNPYMNSNTTFKHFIISPCRSLFCYSFDNIVAIKIEEYSLDEQDEFLLLSVMKKRHVLTNYYKYPNCLKEFSLVNNIEALNVNSKSMLLLLLLASYAVPAKVRIVVKNHGFGNHGQSRRIKYSKFDFLSLTEEDVALYIQLLQKLGKSEWSCNNNFVFPLVFKGLLTLSDRYKTHKTQHIQRYILSNMYESPFSDFSTKYVF